MRILQIIQRCQLRGAEVFACQLSTELQSVGYEVDIAVLFGGQKDIGFKTLKFVVIGANQSRRLFDLKGMSSLAKIVKSGKYDIVQANAGDTLRYAVLSRLLYRWKAKLVFRNANLMSSFFRSPWTRVMYRWLLLKTDVVISVSDNCRADVNKICQPSVVDAVTIPIGTYNFDATMPATLTEIAGDKLILAVGSLVPEKNHLFLLEVFDSYRSKGGAARLIIVGDGRLRPDLEKKIAKMKYGRLVHLLGYHRDVISIMKAASVLAMPSLIEGLPGVILEAFSCGLPVIASSVGGIPEVVHTGVTGICIESSTVDSWCAALQEVLENSDVRTSLTSNARAVFQENYTMDIISNRFLHTYKQLMLKDDVAGCVR